MHYIKFTYVKTEGNKKSRLDDSVKSSGFAILNLLEFCFLIPTNFFRISAF